MKKLLSTLLILSMLLSLCVCASAESDPMAIYRTGSPWICTDLEGVVTEDIPAELKDNFALYVNRDFYLNAEIPEGYYSTGTVDDLSVMISNDLMALFQDGMEYTDHDSKLAKAFYDLILDWDTRNALGVAPLKAETDVIEGIQTLDELSTYYREYPLEKQLFTPFDVGVDTDLIDPNVYIALAGPCSVLLKDSAEYSQRTDLGERYLEGYRGLAVGMLLKLGYTEERALQMWDEAYRLDEMMAPYIHTNNEMNSPDYLAKINNHLTRDELVALQGRMPVVEYLEEAFGMGRQENWIVTNPRFLEAMQTIFVEENLPLFKSLMIVHGAINNSLWLDRDCQNLRWECNLIISGSAPLPDEIVAAELTQNNLAWQTAHMYCGAYFTQQDKDAIESIIHDVVDTYKEMLLGEDFISEETKAAALRKLDTMRIRALYPDDWDAYTDPELNFRSPAEGGTLSEARNALQQSFFRREREKVQKPVDHELWSGMTPTTVNCFYSSTNNSINILAAFCRGEMYSDGMSLAEIYGKMGLVVGHEITHAFDSTGSQFDENGAFRDWWTDADKVMFLEKNSRLADYFNSITLWEGENVNGAIKTGEACADMGAMKCLLTMAAAQEDFDYDTFFRSYAECWANKSGLFLVQYIQKDTHPMGYLRVNTVLQQFDEFLDFYGIQEGDGMYLAKENRVAIW